MPLVLTRRIGESVEIGHGVTVTVLDIIQTGGGAGRRANVARLSITAPPEVEIHRTEVARRIEAGEPQKPKPVPDTAYPYPPVYLLVTRVHEVHGWLRDVVGIPAEPLVLARMLVLCTKVEHVHGLTGFKFYVMPGTDPLLVTAASLRPGAHRLTDFQMLEQTANWRRYTPTDEAFPAAREPADG